MKTTFASLALFVAGALGQQLTINTPANVVECQPTMLTWTGGVGPYFLHVSTYLQSILPGATPNGAAIEQFPATNATSLTWICNIASNTNIGLTLRDGAGTVAQSAPFTINAGTSTTCTNVTSVVPGPTSASAAPPASSPNSVAPGTTAPGTSAAGTSAAGTPASGTATSAPAATSSKSAASANIAQVGAAGVVGAAVAALFL